MPKESKNENEPVKGSDLARVWSAALLAFLVGTLVSAGTIWRYETNRIESKRRAVTDLSQKVAQDIQNNLNLSLSSTYALAAVIRQGHGKIENFPKLAREMLELYHGISCLQLAPDGIIRQAVPLAGNEKAIGHNLLEDNKRNKEAILALRTKSLTLAGPFKLIQGGQAAIGRLPVLIRDDDNGTERFWGFSIAVLRTADFFKNTNLAPILQGTFHYQISRIHPDTGKRDVFWSEGGALQDPVSRKIQVPNGEWTLSVAPVEGWYSTRGVVAEAVLALFIGALSGLAAWWLARQPVVLQRMVEERTRELSESHARLEREIAERENAEEALQASELKLRSIFASLTDVILIVDADGRCLEVAPTHTNRLYLPSEKLLGRTFHDIFPSGQADLFLAAIGKTLATGGITSVDYQLDIDGEQVWFTGNVSPMSEKLVVWSARDITQRKQAEEERLKLEKQMLHTQKLESLGVLAGGIAHDFNNILTVIVGNADLALTKLPPDSPAAENLLRVETAAARASELARQMLDYSGKGRFVVEALDLNELVEDMGQMLEVSISKKAQLRYNCHRPLPEFKGDATQIRQILMNLVINASEAIGDQSGVISISTGCVECNDDYFKSSWLSDHLQQGPYVYLEVGDNGCGMDKETVAKIFDPFFTTKFTGRGLGMAAVLGIVRGHQGAIKVYSEPGKGTTFKLLFPAAALPAKQSSEEQEDSLPWQGSGTVLLVDDEETILELGREMLKELGFEVVTAGDGWEAVEVFQSRDDISLVILDLTMPRLDGEECFRALRRLDPQLKVVMSSGFTQQEVTDKLDGIAGFIQKPYKLSTLRELLRSL
uniref:histidine kinase n=1 Tax=Geobacter sp. (strain M21) TaxID=443144 RepID=C6E2J0_GEOSM